MPGGALGVVDGVNPAEVVLWCIGGMLALFIGVIVLALAWPFLLCWYFGYPAIGVLAGVIYLAALR